MAACSVRDLSQDRRVAFGVQSSFCDPHLGDPSPRGGGGSAGPQALDGGLHAPFTALPEPQQLQDVPFLIILPHPEFL